MVPAPKLLDIAYIVHTHGTAISWELLIQRADAWEMRALVGSALYNVASFFQVTLPPAARLFAEPKGYVQRVQWRIARQAILDQLSPLAASKIVRVAPFLVVDRLRAMKYLIHHGAMGTSGRERRGVHVAAAAFRRIMTGLSILPSLTWVAASATMRTEHHNSSGALR